MEIFDRIKEIRKDFFNDSNIKFAEFMGEKTATTSGWVGGKRGIGKNVLDKILLKLPEVNPTWLFTGEGSIRKTANENPSQNANSTPSCNEAITLSKNYIINVPLVNQYAQAGYLCGFEDTTYISSLPTIPFIADHEAEGNYVIFEVRGDSMNNGTEDSYLEGDRLLCREMYPQYWAEGKLQINKWDFVIVHEDGILVKRILDHDVENHIITIHSLNDMYPDRKIDLAEVRQIFNVVELQRPRRR